MKFSELVVGEKYYCTDVKGPHWTDTYEVYLMEVGGWTDLRSDREKRVGYSAQYVRKEHGRLSAFSYNPIASADSERPDLLFSPKQIVESTSVRQARFYAEDEARRIRQEEADEKVRVAQERLNAYVSMLTTLDLSSPENPTTINRYGGDRLVVPEDIFVQVCRTAQTYKKKFLEAEREFGPFES